MCLNARQALSDGLNGPHSRAALSYGFALSDRCLEPIHRSSSVLNFYPNRTGTTFIDVKAKVNAQSALLCSGRSVCFILLELSSEVFEAARSMTMAQERV